MNALIRPLRLRDLLSVLVSSVAVGSAIGCGSSLEPKPVGVTMLVRNTTCDPGPCVALRVLGFPNNHPHTPGGFWSLDLGIVLSSSACVMIPPTATFRVTNAGTGATTTYSWTSGDSLSLASIPSSASVIQAAPTTGAFVPMHASGWSVALPSSSGPTPNSACTPFEKSFG